MNVRIFLWANVFVLVSMINLSSCGNSDSNKEEGTKTEILAEEVIAIHDEVMPKMAQMVYLKDSLQGYIKTWEEEKSNEGKIGLFKEASKSLDKADKLMMDWMRGYKIPEEGDNSQEIIDYLTAEKGKVEKMKTAVLESIEQTQKLLEDELNNN